MAIEGRGRCVGFVVDPEIFGSVDSLLIVFGVGAVVISGSELTCTRGNAIDGSVEDLCVLFC